MIAPIVQAQFTDTYTFPTGLADAPSLANVTFTPVSATNVSTTYSTTNQNFTTNQWVTGSSSADTSEYLSFGLQANAGFNLSLTQLTFKESRSATGPASMSIALWVDGVLRETSFTFATTNTSSTTTASMSLRTFDFADLTSITATSLVQFRVYAWGGTGSTGTLRLDDLSISGNVSAVPEPSAYAAFAGAAVLLGVIAQRRYTKRRTAA